MMDDRLKKTAANVLRRVARTSGISVMELARQGRVGYEALLAAINSERPLPTKDAIRICMISGVRAADIA